MDQQIIAYALLGALAIGLLVSIYSDFRHRLILNAVKAPIALAAPLYWYATGAFGWPVIGYQLLLALGVFGLFTLFFALGAMGGGDVKLFTALALWFPWDATTRLLFYASLLGLLVTIVFYLSHRIQKKTGRARIPYGIAISIAGLLVASEPIFNHFG
jgi:prepilin peptidase CpaA